MRRIRWTPKRLEETGKVLADAKSIHGTISELGQFIKNLIPPEFQGGVLKLLGLNAGGIVATSTWFAPAGLGQVLSNETSRSS